MSAHLIANECETIVCAFLPHPSWPQFLILRFPSSPIRPHSNSDVTRCDLSARGPSRLAFQLDATHGDVDQFQTFHSRRGSGRVSYVIVFGTICAAAARQDHWKGKVGVEARQ